MKKKYDNLNGDKETYYIRDMAGKIMAVYDKTAPTELALKEIPVYASGRVGVAFEPTYNIQYQKQELNISYELSDHLGNVRATFTDNVLGSSDPKDITNSYSDYYPFGLPLQKLVTPDKQYRFGYQGQFAEDEVDETGYNHFELRDYDPVIGRWVSPDPMGQFFSPYLSVANNPVTGIDPTGGEMPWYVNEQGDLKWISSEQESNYNLEGWTRIGDDDFFGVESYNEVMTWQNFNQIDYKNFIGLDAINYANKYGFDKVPLQQLIKEEIFIKEIVTMKGIDLLTTKYETIINEKYSYTKSGSVPIPLEKKSLKFVTNLTQQTWIYNIQYEYTNNLFYRVFDKVSNFNITSPSPVIYNNWREYPTSGNLNYLRPK